MKTTQKQTLQAVLRKIRELGAEAERLEQAKAEGIRELRRVILKYNLSSKDLHTAKASVRSVVRVSSLRGRKLAPKYRNPHNKSETWTGRGRMPRWIAALVKNGSKPSDFLIER